MMTISSTSTAGATHSTALKHQLKRFYHADGFIKSIGHVAYRTIYSPDPRIRKAWKRTTRHLIHVRADAKQKIEAIRSPPSAVDSCLDSLLRREGGYNPHATNPTSGAYGGPQALPGSKMASAGADWADNIWTQIRWMKGYVNARYGGSCAALEHSLRYNWY